ncbi:MULTISPECIES: MobF family relaxase [Bacteria]|uniref:MobF family relaxase n=1 Tax=Bacteria TaxID=2 RepID=UPI003C7D95DD
MRGGVVFFRGAGAAARAYLESDHSHADEYYLEGGGAVAAWSALDAQGVALDEANLDGESYQAWVDWKDPRTGVERGVPREEVRARVDGELRITPSSPRFVEMTVNVDKSLSVAAALNPDVSAALDAAEAAAAQAMNTYMATNSVTRVGPRGAQRFVPVERLESVSVVHRSSRAGDPHRHVHVQWSTRVYAEGSWRGMHTAATLRQQGALRGVGEAAINSHAGLRRALAAAGFTFDAATGKVVNLEQHAQVMSKRAQQIDRNVLRFEAEWRKDHPGQEPDKTIRREWDQQAWSHERPRKRKSSERPEDKWIDELRASGLQVDDFGTTSERAAVQLHDLDRNMLRADAIAAVENRGSAWSIADLSGRVGEAVGRHDVTATPDAIDAFVQDVAADIAAHLPVLETNVNGEIPTWVRNLTSDRVLRVEREILEALDARGMQSGLALSSVQIGGLSAAQSAAAAALGSGAPLIVVEGAAGSGKTTMLAAARDIAAADGRSLVVVAPTLRAAQEASSALGTRASSAHKLAHEYGFRWTDDGRWTRLALGDTEPVTGGIYRGPSAGAAVSAVTRIVVDEAGMLDQDLAHALITISDETGASLGFIGDRAQLPAVGRGGVLDIAVAASPRPLDLNEVHRFREEGYAELTIAMRNRTEPGALFDELHRRGNIVIHDSDASAWGTIAADVVAKAEAGATVAVAVASNDAAAQLNALVQDARARAGHTRKPAVDVAGADGLSIRVGDRIMTRNNNKELRVANRDTWTVQRVRRDGSVDVVDGARRARLPREYVEKDTHLAYAATEYGVQGATVDFGHGVVTDSSSAQAVYVSATRGREHNAVHLVAGDVDEARAMFRDALGREAGDRGVEAAREGVRRDLDGIVLPPAVDNIDPALRAERIAAEERQFAGRTRDWEAAVASWQERHPGDSVNNVAGQLDRLRADATAATAEALRIENTLADTVDDRRTIAWKADYAVVDQAATEAGSASVFRRRAAEEAHAESRDRFVATHGHEPSPEPPAEVRTAWRRQATAPGQDPQLDAARRRAAELHKRHDHLQQDPPPVAPARPTPGSPQQEAAKDARYAQRKAQRAQRDIERITTPRTPQTRAPRPRGPER